MNGLLPHLLRPGWLLMLPLLGWLLWRLWHRQRRVGRWQQLLPPALQAVLLTRGRLRNSRLPWALLGAGWLLACLALIGPSWVRIELPTFKRADPLVVLLEVTPAMLASDAAPTRLEQAKRKIMDLLAAREDAQTAVVVFAGSAHTLVPLSDDLATTQNLLQAVRPGLMPEPGRRTELAVAQGLALLEQGGQGRGRLLLIGSGLDEQAREQIRVLLAGAGSKLSILGIGTAEGAPIRAEDGSFIKDDQGGILVPRLDSAALRSFARELGGRYQSARLDESDLAGLGLLDVHGSAREAGERARLDAWYDQGYWLLLPLLLIAAFGARKGWLFCLPLLALLVPPPAQAMQWDDFWLRPDQQGARLLEQNRPQAAAERFEDFRWRGLARYQAGDFDGAAQAFAEGNTAADHYNRGNALARVDALDEAIEAYDQALDIDPSLEQARRNRALVEQLRQQRKAATESQSSAGQPDQPPAADQSTAQPSPGMRAATPEPGERPTASEPAGPGATDAAPEQLPEAAEDDNAAPTGADRPAAAQDEAARPGSEARQATEQWLRQIPDEPGELLRRKFLYEQRKRQEMRP